MCAAMRIGIAACILAAGLVCSGQDAQKQTPQRVTAGSLSGTVYCADTNGPARLAQVNLVQYSETSYESHMFARTDLDGRFALKSLPEGDYYLAAVLPGYVDLLSVLTKAHLDSMTAEDRKKMLAQVPKVSVSAGQPAHVSIRLERSAKIDGIVLYDDGSPAPGLLVSYEPITSGEETKDVDGWMMADVPNTFSGPSLTDDQGRFKIFGVPVGEYLVRVTVPTRFSVDDGVPRFAQAFDPFDGLNVYVGGGLRASKAERIKVDAGGATKNADITVPLSKLHTVRGRVLLKSTGQPPVFANVRLLYADSREQARSVYAPGGNFEMNYVAEGSYILKAAAGATAPPIPENYEGQSYHHIVWTAPQPGKRSPEIPLLVAGDLDNVTISVPDPSATDEKGMSFEFLVGTQPAANSSDD